MLSRAIFLKTALAVVFLFFSGFLEIATAAKCAWAGDPDHAKGKFNKTAKTGIIDLMETNEVYERVARQVRVSQEALAALALLPNSGPFELTLDIDAKIAVKSTLLQEALTRPDFAGITVVSFDQRRSYLSVRGSKSLLEKIIYEICPSLKGPDPVDIRLNKHQDVKLEPISLFRVGYSGGIAGNLSVVAGLKELGGSVRSVRGTPILLVQLSTASTREMLKIARLSSFELTTFRPVRYRETVFVERNYPTEGSSVDPSLPPKLSSRLIHLMDAQPSLSTIFEADVFISMNGYAHRKFLAFLNGLVGERSIQLMGTYDHSPEGVDGVVSVRGSREGILKIAQWDFQNTAINAKAVQPAVYTNSVQYIAPGGGDESRIMGLLQPALRQTLVDATPEQILAADLTIKAKEDRFSEILRNIIDMGIAGWAQRLNTVIGGKFPNSVQRQQMALPRLIHVEGTKEEVASLLVEFPEVISADFHPPR